MAKHRHKRETNARKFVRAHQVAAPVALVATLGTVGVGVLVSSPVAQNLPLASSPGASIGESVRADTGRTVALSRSATRQARREAQREQAEREAAQERRATAVAVRQAETELWTTTELNVWTDPTQKAVQVGVIDAGKKVLVTGRRDAGRAEVVVDGKSRWVNLEYLVKDKPELGPSLGGVCANGSVIDAGRASLYEIHDVVCANWPQITSYGTWRGDGEHGQGRAMDIMISGETGWQVAEFLRANYSALGIEYIIYSQHIWSVERGGEGWRAMSNRGSVTANHYDHVHVTVY